MAHIGKFWKLQFRRDLANVSNNREAWPEAYTVEVFSVGGIPAFNGGIPPQLCINKLTVTQPPMVWTSEAFVHLGKTYTWNLTFVDPWNASSNTGNGHLRLTEATLGVVIDGDYPFTGGFPTQMGGFMAAPPGTFQPGYEPGPSNRYQVAINPAGWLVYP